MLSPWGYYYYYPSGVLILTSLQQAVRYWKSLSPHSWWLGAVGVQNGRRLHDNLRGERNSTSTKGRSRWKSSSENYLLIAEVRFRLRIRVRISIWVRDSKTIFHENYLWWMSNCVFQSTNSKCNVRPQSHTKRQALNLFERFQFCQWKFRRWISVNETDQQKSVLKTKRTKTAFFVHTNQWRMSTTARITKAAKTKSDLGTTCLFWLLVQGIPVIITNNDIYRAVLKIENVCVQSFGHIKWALNNFVHGQTLFNLQRGSLFTTFEVCRVS